MNLAALARLKAGHRGKPRYGNEHARLARDDRAELPRVSAGIAPQIRELVDVRDFVFDHNECFQWTASR
jgi:hypothetical protein